MVSPRKSKKTISNKSKAHTDPTQVDLANKPPIIPTAIYTRKEVAALTGASESTIYRAEQNGELKRSKEGNPRYAGAAILEWMGVKMANLNVTINVVQPSST